MDTTFSAISNNIKTRRTIKPSTMNGQKIPNGHIASILELADWAPTHGLTEPWRFIVFETPTAFCAQHAEIYKEANPGEAFNATTYANLTSQGNNASHVVIAVMKRGDLPKIPVKHVVRRNRPKHRRILEYGRYGVKAGICNTFWFRRRRPGIRRFIFRLHRGRASGR